MGLYFCQITYTAKVLSNPKDLEVQKRKTSPSASEKVYSSLKKKNWVWLKAVSQGKQALNASCCKPTPSPRAGSHGRDPRAENPLSYSFTSMLSQSHSTRPTPPNAPGNCSELNQSSTGKVLGSDFTSFSSDTPDQSAFPRQVCDFQVIPYNTPWSLAGRIQDATPWHEPPPAQLHSW